MVYLHWKRPRPKKMACIEMEVFIFVHYLYTTTQVHYLSKTDRCKFPLGSVHILSVSVSVSVLDSVNEPLHRTFYMTYLNA